MHINTIVKITMLLMFLEMWKGKKYALIVKYKIVTTKGINATH